MWPFGPRRRDEVDRGCGIAGHLEQVRAHGVETKVPGRTGVGVEGLKQPSGRPADLF
jgi:hypothetical protein